VTEYKAIWTITTCICLCVLSATLHAASRLTGQEADGHLYHRLFEIVHPDGRSWTVARNELCTVTYRADGNEQSITGRVPKSHDLYIIVSATGDEHRTLVFIADVISVVSEGMVPVNEDLADAARSRIAQLLPVWEGVRDKHGALADVSTSDLHELLAWCDVAGDITNELGIDMARLASARGRLQPAAEEPARPVTVTLADGSTWQGDKETYVRVTHTALDVPVWIVCCTRMRIAYSSGR